VSPSTDHPRDKPTFDVAVLVPNGVEAISNGVMTGPPREELAGWSRWYWRTTKPMAPYLAFMTIGQYDIRTDVSQTGQPVITAYSQNLGAFGDAAKASVERTSEII